MNHVLPLGKPALTPDENLAITLARRLDGSAKHVDIGRDTANGLTKLVLALLNVIHELLERQAMRRIEGGSLSDAQAEALGDALMRQALTILELCDQLGITRSFPPGTRSTPSSSCPAPTRRRSWSASSRTC